MASEEEEATSAALEGETPQVQVPPDRMFEAKPVWQRMIIILAGVTMNILFAWLIFSGLNLKIGKAVSPVTTIGQVDSAAVPAGAEAFRSLKAGDRITAVNGAPVYTWNAIYDGIQHTAGDSVVLTLADGRQVAADIPADAVDRRVFLVSALTPFVAAIAGRVESGRPAAKAGLAAGDTILSAAGQPIEQWTQLVTVIEASPGRPLELEVGRSTGRLKITVTPESTSVADSAGSRIVGKIGMAPDQQVEREPYTFLEALKAGFDETVNASTVVVRTLKGVLRGNVARASLGGPIAIGQMAGQSARMGWNPSSPSWRSSRSTWRSSTSCRSRSWTGASSCSSWERQFGGSRSRSSSGSGSPWWGWPSWGP